MGLNVFALFTGFGLGSLAFQSLLTAGFSVALTAFRRHRIARRCPRRPPLPRRTGGLTACGRDRVDDGALQAARDAGASDAEIGGVVAHLALNVLMNHFNMLAKVDNDRPVVTPRSAV
ncbi:hypothetical protein [Streptomyces jeddahensis]|uniref:Carboxymuconolactone decarboxylase family protein n=1 Tax=Streptomyces jeddahensis TaxID=1716141 RepID=A0A177I067_9ACTN|nr:hypothetical protein [Streptomyces jeddahensis]OAH15964.1 hypothetical protein STSP_06670 [Streptomyces jeddahensis]